MTNVWFPGIRMVCRAWHADLGHTRFFLLECCMVGWERLGFKCVPEVYLPICFYLPYLIGLQESVIVVGLL